ncbi:MAG: hypothetical protein GX051_09800 [Clostridiales bacterium]|nr:hypothetical protein [Clostridiales bacterium]
MKKNSTAITAIIVVIALIASAGALWAGGAFSSEKKPAAPTTTAAPVSDSKDSPLPSASAKTEKAALPMLSTGLGNLFYTCTNDGVVAFYGYSDGVFTAVDGAKTTDVSLTVNSSTVSAKIYYINYEGKTIGYGLYTSQTAEPVYGYEYAFFKLCDLPQGYSASGNYLLMFDSNKADFNSENKRYGECFLYNLSTGKASFAFKQNNRSFDLRGLYRADFTVLTNEAIAASGSTFYFLSGRFYDFTDAKLGDLCDVYARSGSSDTRYITGVLGQYIKSVNGGILVIKPCSGGFETLLYKGSSSESTKKYTGDYYADYIRSGDYLVSVKNGKIYNLVTGEEKALGISDANFVPEVACVTADGSAAFVRGYVRSGDSFTDKALVYSAGTAKIYADERFKNASNPSFLPDGKLIYWYPVENTATPYAYDIVTL